MSFLRFSTDPFEDMMRLQRALSRSLSRPFAGLDWTTSGRDIFPGLNVFEEEGGNSIVVKAEMPGVKKEELKIEIEGNRLAIEGSRQVARATEGDRYHRRERRGGEFRRVFRLPFEVDRDTASASYDEGILTVRLEKTESAKPRQIALKA